MATFVAQLSQTLQPAQHRPAHRESSNFREAKSDAGVAKRFPRISLLLVLLLTALVRLPGLSRPLVGPFATKNAVYAMIARNWATGRAPLWLPTVDCLVGGARGLHLLELPLASYLSGAGWAFCGGSLDVWGRAVSVAFSMASVALLYVLTRRWHGEWPAAVAALVLALSPISIFCGQSFMLESSAVCFMLCTLWGLERWLETARFRWWLLTAVGLALMLGTKIYLLVMLLPLVGLCLRRIANLPRAARRRWVVGCLLLIVVGLAPTALWCLMVTRITSPEHPLAQQVYYSFWRSATVHGVPNPLLWKAEFYMRFFKGIAGSGLTPAGFFLAAIGLCQPSARRHLAWLAAMGLLVILLPGKFFELRYYLLILVPVCAVLAGLGCEYLARHVRAPRSGIRENSGRLRITPRDFLRSRQLIARPDFLRSRLRAAARMCLASCLMFGFAGAMWSAVASMWSQAPEDRAVTTAAAALRGVSAANEPVVTLHGAAPDLLYYCDRPGWALSVNDSHFDETLERCRRQGARWLVVADLASLAGKPAAQSIARLPIEHAGDDFVICRLAP